MVRRATKLFGFTLHATDGEIGKVQDLYFDDQDWHIRYLVTDVGSWLFGRFVLIAPTVAHDPDWDTHELPVQLTKEQVAHSPDIDLAKPVSRQHELELSQYYGWPMYWAGSPPLIGAIGGMEAGAWPAMSLAEQQSAEADAAAPDDESDDPHLRSIREVIAYIIRASDEDIGQVEDFLIDETDWSLCALLVNTSHWLRGKQRIIPLSALDKISWPNATVYVRQTSAQIEAFPEYDPDLPLAAADVARLYSTEQHPEAEQQA